MNLSSNAMHEPQPQIVAPAPVSVAQHWYWSVQREIWENRFIYIVPLTVGALSLLGFVISAFHLPEELRSMAALDSMKRHELAQRPYIFAAALLMLSSFIVAVFYCLDALYSERRDRSILFWKSLPVSDLTTVLSKASIPILALPLVTIVMMLAVGLVMLLLSSVVAMASGVNVASLWDSVSLVPLWLALSYHLMTAHVLYYVPIYAWLLLVSAGSRRAPFLWAILPPLAIGVFEKIAFNTTNFANMMKDRMMGGSGGPDFTPATLAMHPLAHLAPLHFLGAAGLWVGLAIGAIFIAAAIQLRRLRGPI